LTSPKIAILVVAYNAEDTLHHVLDRIPTEFAQRVSVVLVCDDASTDSTHSQALKYQQRSKLPWRTNGTKSLTFCVAKARVERLLPVFYFPLQCNYETEIKPAINSLLDYCQCFNVSSKSK
jgi:glycosyltransferase involved in cell wall biosynthesis